MGGGSQCDQDMPCGGNGAWQDSWDTWGQKGHRLSSLQRKAGDSMSSNQGFDSQAQVLDCYMGSGELSKVSGEGVTTDSIVSALRRGPAGSTSAQ